MKWLILVASAVVAVLVVSAVLAVLIIPVLSGGRENIEGILPIAILCLALGGLGLAFVVCLVGIVWVGFSVYFELLGDKEGPIFFK